MPDEVIHIPEKEGQEPQTETTPERVPGLGETETLPGGGRTVGDSVPDMPPGSDMADYRGGGGLDAADTAQPPSTADTTGDRATGLTGLRGG